MDAFDLSQTFVHLGLGARAVPLPDFEWSAAYLEQYDATTASDGDEGRLVSMSELQTTWDTWERHPAGEEVVVLLSGRVDMVQDLGEQGEHVVALGPGQAVVNPTNVWHTTRVHVPGQALFITPGRGTEHRPL